MNKKFLSAILFGALMVTSTGTFVSCKDYDDDIKDLQEQINSNKDAIAALQKLVGEGNWVTGITSIADGFTVTMSNGQSTTITGIKGEDGKNGVEWTIGEDGFWYKDGEKTTHQAVAEDGKPGATAPSPSISADGKWVVYEWDATKGEFVAKTTEIPAQGTSAYVVKKDGVYVLHIADETGAFQDVTLPATSDSFVVEAPAAFAQVWFETAKWEPTTTNKAYQKIVKEFPEVAEIAKNTLLKQGGHLPVLVNPANVELTNDYKFSLQTYNGKTPDIAIANPQKGLIGVEKVASGMITTRSADASDNYWTLQAEPTYNTKTKKYEETSNAALVVENAKGTVVKSAFAYSIKAKELASVDKVKVNGAATGTATGNALYAPSIDLFASFENKSGVEETPITFENNYIGYYIIELADALQTEQYDLSIAEDGHTLNIGNMPANVSEIKVTLDVTALGLNGSATTVKVTLTISQEMVVAGELEDKIVTLKVNEDGTYTQNVLWSLTPLKMTATQLNQIMTATNKTITVSWIDEDGDPRERSETMLCKKADGTTNATDYSNLAQIGFKLDAADYAEGEYTVLFTFANGSTVVYSAEATMNVVNPSAADVFYLAKAYVENGALTVVGNYNVTGEPNMITYTLKNGVVAPAYAKLVGFEDYDHTVWSESLGTATEPGAKDWVQDGETLKVYKNGVKAVGTDITEANVNASGTVQNMLYVKRNIRATYELFGNANNKVTYEFPVVVKSAIYNADPTKAIVLDEEGLTAEFGGDPIDIRYAISGIYAAGINKDKEYGLFDISGKKETTYKNYNVPSESPSADGYITYALNPNGLMVEIDLNDMSAFGFSGDVILEAQKDSKVRYYVVTTVDATQSDYEAYANVKTWGDIWNVAKKYYDAVTGDDGNIGYKRNNVKVDGDDAAVVALFNTYSAKIAFASTVQTTYPAASTRAAEILPTKLDWANKSDAEKYVDIDNSDIANGSIQALADVNKADLVEGKATVAVKLTVTDKWGMTMTRTIDVTLVAPED